MWGWLFCIAAVAVLSTVDSAGAGAARLVCYVDSARADTYSECTHLVYTGDARGDKLDNLLKDYRKNNPRLKIILRVTDTDKDLRALLKSKHIQGLEVQNAHKSLNRTSVVEKVEQARSALSSSAGGPLFLALPAHPELLAKYYDLRTLVKKVDLLMVETHALGLVKKMTYHPSRLSGLWDMMNTDSVVDLVVGLGVPATKIVISLPATVRQFTLVNETLSTPGSPTIDDEPKVVDQAELCRQLQRGRWTLERDQDLSAPYSFKNTTWMSFEDASSVDVKGKYARVRGLAGIALHNADKDTDTPCGQSLRASLAKVLNQQSRAPRAAVLRSLEHEILSAPGHARALDALQVSPYRITQVVDSDGVIHSIREDTRTEFHCSRQGYFVHPRSCARFYRCVKFDQLSPEYTVFEFDCPAGLAFDSRYEVCVWPGSLPHTQACPGSSEIAPVPKTRFVCPEHEGYYADPENCRWFFACLDHGKAPLTAYEFRCPFGLGFDAAQLKCDWPWHVPACGNIARYEAEAYGYSGATLTGATGYQGQTADSVNIAAHQSLVSGASLNNLVGIQGGFLSQADTLDSNFIASQELANEALGAHSLQVDSGIPFLGHGLNYQAGGALESSQAINVGLVQPTRYNEEGKYTSGSLILDDYRFPTKGETTHIKVQNTGSSYNPAEIGLKVGQSAGFLKGHSGHSTSSFSSDSSGQNIKSQSGSYEDESGAYVHDPSGDYAEPYRHVGSSAVPYIHDGSVYKDSGEYYDSGKYSGFSQSGYDGKYTETINAEGKYVDDNRGHYVYDNSGAYVESNIGSAGYKSGYSGSSYGYKSSYSNGDYRADYLAENNGQYKTDNSGAYVADSSGSYKHDDFGKYEGGVYRADGHIGNTNTVVGKGIISTQYQNGYSEANADKYLSDSSYTGGSHVLTAGAVNVELVGKTTLVDAEYNNQNNYQGLNGHQTVSYGHQTLHPEHVSIVSQPAVTINHVGTDENNFDGYSFVTTPTSSGVPTTATPFAVTTSLPAVTTYKTTFVPEAPKSSIKQIFGYSQPGVTFVQPTVIPIKQVVPTVQIANQNQGFNYQFEDKDYSAHRSNQDAHSETARFDYSSNYENTAQSHSNIHSESSGYDYLKPSIQLQEGLTYTTSVPIAISTYKPQGFAHSQQTIHEVDSVGFGYSTPTPVREEPFKKLVAYTTGAGVAAYAPTTYRPQAFSHQTIHKVEATHRKPSAEIGTGYLSDISYEEPKIVQYTTDQPAIGVQQVVSTYQPQVFSHQTLHKVDASKVNAYSKDESESYSQVNAGYTYDTPSSKFEEVKTIQYTTPAPIVSSTYRPQAYSHQTIHKVQNYASPIISTSLPKVELTYQAPITYQNPILKYTENVTPITYKNPSYKSQAFSHQTIHEIENSKPYDTTINTGLAGLEFIKSASYEEPKVVYSTAQTFTPAQSFISSFQPHVVSHQTLHEVDTNQYQSQSENAESGYTYEKPGVTFEDVKASVEYSTPAPIVSTYRPQSYNHQTIHKVATQKVVPVISTITPIVDYSFKQADVSTYENPLLKFTQKVTPTTYVKPTATVFTQTYQPIVHQQVSHISQQAQYEDQKSYAGQNLQFGQDYSYSQPEIQRNIETSNTAYSDANIVSHQTFHLANTKSQYNSGKETVFVSTTPSVVTYEDHYTEYEAPGKFETYQAKEYTPLKSDYQQSYTISTASTPIVHESSIIHNTQDQYDYKPVDHSQQFETVQNVPIKQVAFSTSHVQQPEKLGSVHVSSYPGSIVTTKYNQGAYENPEIQVAYKTEEYLPPVVSTVTPIITSTYRPRFYSTTSTTREYLPPANENSYSIPSTTRTFIRPTTESYNYVEAGAPSKASEYLPPVDTGDAKLLHFESFGFDNADFSTTSKINPYQDYSVPKDTSHRKQNIVVQTAKSHQLGFGTIGPDAGLVSPVTYTTAAPIVVSTTSRPLIKFTTQKPSYGYVQSTTEYNAPEYLPPSQELESAVNFENFGIKEASLSPGINYNQYQEHAQVATIAPKRKNIVVETAKSHLLGFGTIGTDAGLVSPVTYTTAAPVIVSNADSYSLSPKTVTPTYAPEQQGLFEVTPSSVPVRRTKPKVAVVTKINDFNPLLVRKLGAVCSCQSPVLILKGKRPTVQQPDFDDYSDNNDGNIGYVNNNQWNQKSINVHTPTVVTPVVTSTFNPIIVPDNSYYQDYQEHINPEIVVTPKKEVYSQSYVSSTPIAVSTEKTYTIRPRIKAVTVAPTYKTVLLNEAVTPAISVKELESVDISEINSQAFDRYGPGGLRSRDETLQGTVDCKRAGLFRHPKQCNKFYACRWDCTKERFTLHVFNCPIQLSFDPSIGACNWPSQGPACQGDTLLTNAL